MPSRITPLDVSAYATPEVYRMGEQIYENGWVRHRFQTNYGLSATVRSKGHYRVEMIIDGEQFFGRCTCPVGSSRCEHQVALLLTWLNEPQTFTSYQELRKAIRTKEKNALVDILVNLIEVFPDLSSFFISPAGRNEAAAIQEEVANIFDFPQAQKIDPQQIVEACQILFVRAKSLHNEGKNNHARLIYFEILNRSLALIDRLQTSKPFRENFIAEIADDYEDLTTSDPEFAASREAIAAEVEQILAHESAEAEGVFLEQLKQKLG
ncbi:MAG TPA: hypothetical protein PLG50_11330 [bacterium]|nr:hypothetical protein [bacterium]HQG46239.1 hypothetical protein [bacterium]HQI47308.1 hypothetical protein [bacterium]HQJ63795.1 hypothetical protein [bacterium]